MRHSQPRVMIAHPHTAFISQQAAAGLERRGALAGYACGLALPERALPAAVARRLTQRFPLARNRLVSGVAPRHLWPAMGPEALARMGRRWTGDRITRQLAWYDVMFVLHDRMVAALPWPRDVNAIYAYEDGALAIFERARRAGVRRLYDLPIIHYQTLEHIIRAEMECFPHAEPDRVFVEPAWKKRRKDRELDLAEVVFVASAFTRESAMAAGVPEERIEVVPYGFPTDVFEPRPKPPEGPFTVLAVGTQDLRKGTPYLLEAWRRAKLPNARLRLVGGMRLTDAFLAPYRDQFEHLPGLPRTALAAEYQRADLLAFPTLGDGFGLVIQEAMCSGTPVVTTRCGGGPECVTHDHDGFLVPERSIDALVEVFVRSHQRRGELFEMGRAARARAERYTPEEAGEATAQAILRRCAG
jgi:alpha-maltose-1-phosphate synthase